MDVSSTESLSPLEDAILNWIGTFDQLLGEDRLLDNFTQLYDGIILYKIVRALTHLPLGSNVNK